MTDIPTQTITDLADRLSRDPSVLIITGAGVSADSGLPTYRGVGGLYNDAQVEEGVPIEVALSGGMFQRQPEVTWKYIHQIEAACRGALPNAAHRVMAQLEHHLSRVWILTQNVDGLHHRAGSKNLMEIHGNVHHLHCLSCEWRDHVEDYRQLDPCPSCPRCGSLIRPNVVLFDEMLPADVLETYHVEMERGFDIVISAGTTSAFPYIAAPVVLTRRHGGYTLSLIHI